jgi:hypothetical protein
MFEKFQSYDIISIDNINFMLKFLRQHNEHEKALLIYNDNYNRITYNFITYYHIITIYIDLIDYKVHDDTLKSYYSKNIENILILLVEKKFVVDHKFENLVIDTNDKYVKNLLLKYIMILNDLKQKSDKEKML